MAVSRETAVRNRFTPLCALRIFRRCGDAAGELADVMVYNSMYYNEL